MTYRLPVFNLRANVWHNALPADVADGLFLPPVAAPDLTPICQLYLSKYGPGGWFHGWPDSVRVTLERAGYITLRVPLDTDVRCPRWPFHGVTWHDLDLVECPPGSRRWYVVVMVDQAHMGFSNEYRVAILAQIGPVPATGDAGGGGGADAELLTDAGHAGGGGGADGHLGELFTGDAGGGGGADGSAEPGEAVSGHAGGGGGADGSAVPGDTITGDAGGGGGADGDSAIGHTITGDAGGGGGADGSAEPGEAVSGHAGGGGGADGAESHGSGTPAPSSTCAGAPLVTLPFTASGTAPPTSESWWRFAGTAGTTYHVRITASTGGVGSAALLTGDCSGTFPQCTASPSMGTCASFVLGSSGDVKILVTGGVTSGTYTIEVGTGGC